MDYPIPKFHFEVSWGDGKRMGFTEVSGLDYQVEAIEYREGNSRESSKIKMPGMKKYNNVTLKRGTVKTDAGFFEWIDSTKLNIVERRAVTITLLNEAHEPAVAWSLKNCFPVKFQPSDAKADGNEVAIETLELAHEGFTMATKSG